MRSYYKLYAFLLVIGLVFQTTVAAQTLQPEAKNEEVLKPELKEAALKLLASVASEAQQYGLPENRIRSQITIADMLWKHDEAQARTLFQNAYGDLQNMLASASLPEGIELNSTERNKQYSIRYRIMDLRREFVMTLARSDSEGALNALEGLKLAPIDDNDPLLAEDLGLKLTTAIVKKDPNKSYTVARQRLETLGVTYEFINALKELHKKDAPLAANLARDVIAKFKSLKIRVIAEDAKTVAPVDFKTEIDLWQVTSFVSAASEMNRQATREKSKKAAPLLTDAEMKELVEITAGAFLAERNPTQYAISQVMREIARYSPASAQRIRLKIGAEASQQMDKISESNTYYKDTKDKSSDELAKIADVSAPEVRDSRYSTAAFKALYEEEPEKALAIAERIKDRKSYRYLFEQIQAAAPLIKARRGDIVEVRRMLMSFKTNEERVFIVTELAASFAVKGEKETAKALLEEALQLMPAMVRKQTDLEAFAKVAGVYAVADPERAFEIVESSIGQMNEVINAAIRLDEFGKSGAVEQNELLFMAMNKPLLMYVSNASALMKNLAIADFERALGLADKFERPEIRLFLRLRIAQALLDPKTSEREISDPNQLTVGESEDTMD